MSKPNQTDDIFQNLADSITNPRLKQSLERIKDACNFLENSRVAITPTAVGKYCEDRWKGPKTQSIRNAQDTLFRYLQARRAQQVLPVAVRKESYEPAIQDETIRAYVTLLKTERDEAIRLKNRIVAGLRSLPGLPIDDLIASGFKSVPNQKEAERVSVVSDEVRGALSRLFSEENLASVGLELYRQRLRHITTKKVLLEKGDVEALQGLIQAQTEASRTASLPSPAPVVLDDI